MGVWLLVASSVLQLPPVYRSCPHQESHLECHKRASCPEQIQIELFRGPDRAVCALRVQELEKEVIVLRERVAAGGAAPADASAAPLSGASSRGTGTRGGASRDVPGGGGGGAASSRVVAAAVVAALQEELRGARGEAAALQGRLAAAQEHAQAMKERAQEAGDHLHRSADSALFRFCAWPLPRE